MPANHVAVTVHRGQARLAGKVKKWATRMLDAMDLAGAELSVVLCDDDFIRDLNLRYAREDHATDVLAFASSEGPGPRVPGLLGDVVISVDTATRQARARTAPREDELRVLLAHGLLHLLGYDHRFPAEERIMTAKTARLVKEAALRRPLAPRRRRSAP
jgi:probable rRNA maturation factor